jgi:hypothetical protein
MACSELHLAFLFSPKNCQSGESEEDEIGRTYRNTGEIRYAYNSSVGRSSREETTW